MTADETITHAVPDEDRRASAGRRPAGGRGAASGRSGHSSAGARSLSPSRASDFKTCPLLYRFRAVDRLPEVPTPEQARGSLVHAVLERLFDHPAAERTPDTAAALVAPAWRAMRDERADLAELFPPGEGQTDAERDLLDSAGRLLQAYFVLEDPSRLEPAERECLVQTEIDGDLLLRGYVDRLDVSAAGDLRVVDYKTGGAPAEAFEGGALFQLKFYALVLWRARGVVPKALRLLYLKDAEVRDFAPDPDDLARFERTLIALGRAIQRATTDRDFRAKPSKLCQWCGHQVRCPSFGGTPPPFPGLGSLPSPA